MWYWSPLSPQPSRYVLEVMKKVRSRWELFLSSVKMHSIASAFPDLLCTVMFGSVCASELCFAHLCLCCVDSELEVSLLVLPFPYVPDLLKLFNAYVKEGLEVELVCRCLFFLLRCSSRDVALKLKVHFSLPMHILLKNTPFDSKYSTHTH